MLLGTVAGAIGALADRVGVDLGSSETEQNRKSGLGALSGYVVGLRQLDLGPLLHHAYGLMTAVAYDAFTGV